MWWEGTNVFLGEHTGGIWIRRYELVAGTRSVRRWCAGLFLLPTVSEFSCILTIRYTFLPHRNVKQDHFQRSNFPYFISPIQLDFILIISACQHCSSVCLVSQSLQLILSFNFPPSLSIHQFLYPYFWVRLPSCLYRLSFYFLSPSHFYLLLFHLSPTLFRIFFLPVPLPLLS